MNWDWHTRMSFIKSGLRLLGYVALPASIATGAILLAIAEIIGIIEEF